MTVQLNRGILIAIEGIDGAGKTTQARLLAETLRVKGLVVVVDKEPTDGPWAKKIRDSLKSGKRLPPLEELDAFLKDRHQHVREVIGPALDRCEVMILDRYYFSSAAYQGPRGLCPNDVLRKNEAIAPEPDLAVVLEVGVDIGLERIAKRGNGTNVFEKRESLLEVARVFDSLDRDCIHRVDGNKSITEVAEDIYKQVYDDCLFRATCLKPYLTSCEPEFCAGRIEGSCTYPRIGGPESQRISSDVREELDRIAHEEKMTIQEKLDKISALLKK